MSSTAACAVSTGRLALSANMRSIISNIALISAGCLLFVLGMSAVMMPGGLFSGGLTGIAILVNYHLPATNVGVTNFLLNIPLMVLAWRILSRRFFAYTVYGTVFFSVAAAFIQPPAFQLNDPLLAALVAGVVCGAGNGLILRSVGSAGGLDILNVFLNRRFGIRIGTASFTANALVILTGAYLYDIRMALYSIIMLFVSGIVINTVISGFNRRKSVMVISSCSEAIAEAVMQKLGRGVTFLDGEGGYARQKTKILMTVTTATDLPRLKELIFSHDSGAFIVINDTFEVYGRSLGRFLTT